MSYISIGKIDKSAAFEADFEPRFKFLSEKELISLPGPQWLVKHLIPTNSLILMYGAPGAGKSHIALALTQSIANGYEILGRRTNKAKIVYVAAEGAAGASNRVEAHRVYRNIPEDSEGDVLYLDCPVSLLHDNDLKSFVLAIVHKLAGQEIGLVFIDTLSRCFAGDENRADEMAKLVSACQIIQRELGCSVCLVHHEAKQGSARGSTVLPGAADTIIHVTATDGKGFEAVIEKQKDAPDGLVISGRYDLIELGTDEDGESIEVPIALFDKISPQAKGKSNGPKGRNQAIALEVLSEAPLSGLTEEGWQNAFAQCTGSDNRRAFRDAKAALIQRKLVSEVGGKFIAN